MAGINRPLSSVGVPGRGMASTERGQRGVGRLRISVTATSPLSLPPRFDGEAGAGRGLASPIADNRLGQSWVFVRLLHCVEFPRTHALMGLEKSRAVISLRVRK